MSRQKPSLPRGTRDFGPTQMIRRNFILDSIRSTFQKFGFLPLETPAMENLSVLTGKYGDEGDQLLFKILNSGEYHEEMVKDIVDRIPRVSNFFYEFLKNVCDQLNRPLTKEGTRLPSDETIVATVKKYVSNFSRDIDSSELGKYDKEYLIPAFLEKNIEYLSLKLRNFYININHNVNFLEHFNDYFKMFRYNVIFEEIIPKFAQLAFTARGITYQISEKGLRYDLTVPFARYVVMNQNEVKFPFKRYQIQPVWRADRPQKGRYREFYQCDADVVGTDSLLCEAEIVLIIQEVLGKLGVTEYVLKINNRKVLTGLAEVASAPDKVSELCVAIDKLDKIGKEGVLRELTERGFSGQSIARLDPVFALTGTFDETLAQLNELFTHSAAGQQGVHELAAVRDLWRGFGVDESRIVLDTTLARGLSYYTGAIFEVKATNVQIGSIGGGGRYDNLTGAFGLPGVSGVGFSFGVDRLYDVMDELNLFPVSHVTTTRVLFCTFDAEAQRYALPLLRQLREAGVNSELYPEPAKLKKQLDYANNKQIPFVILIGSDEMARGTLTLKNMQTGEQQSLTMADVVSAVTR